MPIFPIKYACVSVGIDKSLIVMFQYARERVAWIDFILLLVQGKAAFVCHCAAFAIAFYKGCLFNFSDHNDRITINIVSTSYMPSFKFITSILTYLFRIHPEIEIHTLFLVFCIFSIVQNFILRIHNFRKKVIFLF